VMVVAAAAVGVGAGVTGATGFVLEPLEPPQFHDASATTMDAARSEDRKFISLRQKQRHPRT